MIKVIKIMLIKDVGLQMFLRNFKMDSLSDVKNQCRILVSEIFEIKVTIKILFEVNLANSGHAPITS